MKRFPIGEVYCFLAVVSLLTGMSVWATTILIFMSFVVHINRNR